MNTIDITQIMGKGSAFCRTTNVLSRAISGTAEYKRVWNTRVLLFACQKVLAGNCGQLTKDNILVLVDVIKQG